MPLPTFALPTGTVSVGGQDVPVRGLSRGEVLNLRPLLEAVADDKETAADIRALEVRLLAHGFDVSEDDASGWYDTTATEAVAPCIEKIMSLSGLADDAERPTSEG